MPTCTKAGLINGAGCFSGARLSNHQQLARRVYFDVLQLAALGGTNYASDTESLNQAANSMSCGFQPDDFHKAELTIAYNNAVSAGATIPSNRGDLAAAVACFEDFSDFQLKQMELYLYCQLGKGTRA